MIGYKKAKSASMEMVKLCVLITLLTLGISFYRIKEFDTIIHGRDTIIVARRLTAFINPTQENRFTDTVEKLLTIYDTHTDNIVVEHPEELPNRWFTDRQVHPDYVPELGSVLDWLSTVRIVKAYPGADEHISPILSGTTAKLRLALESGHEALFKIKNLERNETHLNKSRNELHNAEVAAYHLQRILGFNRAPIAVGRKIDIQKELLPVADESIKENIHTKGDETCLYLHNRQGETIDYCVKDGMIEGVMLLWLPQPIISHKMIIHPKSERKVRKLITSEEQDLQNYTFPKSEAKYLDYIETLFFDHLIQNYDRQCVFYRPVPNSAVILLDNGKGFRSLSIEDTWLKVYAAHDCKVRKSTYVRMKELEHGVLSTVLRKILSHDPIAPVLVEQHYTALDVRLQQITQALDKCIADHGQNYVFS